MEELLERYEQFLHSNANTYLDADEFADIADYYSQQGEELKAVDVVDRALEIFPDAIGLLAFKARSCLVINRDVEAAERYIERAQDKADIEYYYVKAEIILMRNSAEKADEYLNNYYNNVIINEPTEEQDDYFYDVANIFFDYEEYYFCNEWLQRMKNTDAMDCQLLAARTSFYLENFGKSETLYEKLLDEDPFNVGYWQEIAVAQMAQDKVSEALTSVDYALAIDPENEDAALTKANCLLMLDNVKDAHDILEQLINKKS